MIQKTIGRSSENDLVITGDLMVSRNHAILYFDEGSILIEDLNSANGTFVNGNRISTIIKLDEYDILKVGNSLVHWNKLFEESSSNEEVADEFSVVETMTDAPEIPVGTENPENLKTITESRKIEKKNSLWVSVAVVIVVILCGSILAMMFV
jgi:pSer/pThr/pTyr-binding forkhead associated (FHA) protein